MKYIIIIASLFLCLGCMRMNIYDSKYVIDPKDEINVVWTFLGNSNKPMVTCPEGMSLGKVVFERPQWAIALETAIPLPPLFGLVLPSPIVSARQNTASCALGKIATPKIFKDRVVLKNGTVLDNVRVTVTVKDLVIETQDGITNVYKKSEVSSVTKGDP
jgi:hypothetical protein